MTDLSEYAEEASSTAFPGVTGSHFSTRAEMQWQAEQLDKRHGFVQGILHLAARLVEDDAIEAGARSLYERHPLSLVDETTERITGSKPWEWLSPEYQDSKRIEARAVLAAMLAKVAEAGE